MVQLNKGGACWVSKLYYRVLVLPSAVGLCLEYHQDGGGNHQVQVSTIPSGTLRQIDDQFPFVDSNKSIIP